MVTLCPNFSCSVLLLGCFWPCLTILRLDTERTCFLLKQNQRHVAVCKPAQGEGFAWAPVCRAQPSSERLRTSSFQCSKGLAGSPQPQPEAMLRTARSSRSMALAFSNRFGAGEAKAFVRASRSPIQLRGWCGAGVRRGLGAV